MPSGSDPSPKAPRGRRPVGKRAGQPPRLSPRAERAARALGRVLRVVLDKEPLTFLGLLLALAAYAAGFYYGRERQDLVLYVAGFGLAGLVVLAQGVVLLTTILLGLSWRRRRPALATDAPLERLEAGVLGPTGFSLPSLGWLPLVSIRWEWLEPADASIETLPARGRLWERAIHNQRGAYKKTVRRLVVEDVFGLARLALRLVEERPRVVLPARGLKLAAPLLEAMSGGDNISHPLGPPDGDLVEMRRYAPGDPMKRILWKTYARSRTLMVRLPERAFSPTRRTLAYLVAAEGDEPASGIARMAVEAQAFGPDWRFGADGSNLSARTTEEALPLIVGSRDARDRGGHGYGDFLDRSSELGSFRSVLFVPPRPGAWLDPIERQVKLHAGRIEVIIGTDGVRDAAGRGRWHRYFVVPLEDERAEHMARVEEVEEVTQRLLAAGARVTVVDRQSGRSYGRATRRRAA